MSITRTRNGAVHIMFLIVTVIIAAAFVVLWFVQLQENERLQQETTQARRQAELSNLQREFRRRCYQIVADLVGPTVPNEVRTPTDLAEARTITADDVMEDHVNRSKRQLNTFMEDIGVTGVSPDNFFAAFGPAKSKVQEQQTKINELQLTISNKEGEISSLQDQITQIQTTHESARTQAQSQYDTRIENLSSQRSQLETQNESLSTRNTDLTNEISSVRERANREQQRLTRELKALEGQVQTIKRPVRMERMTEKPDGRVLASDPSSGRIYVDIGSKDLLRLGTRFKVYETGKGGEKIHKGWMRITHLDPDKAEARVDELAGNGPILSGDWIFNPYYSPGEKQHFVFLGELPGSWSRETAQQALSERGAVIQDHVDVHTDFLVLGQRESLDAPPLEDSEDYQRALRYGVQILRGRDLTPYLRF